LRVRESYVLYGDQWEVINPKLEYQNYLSSVGIVMKKINIAKIRRNSHELQSEIGRWTTPRTSW